MGVRPLAALLLLGLAPAASAEPGDWTLTVYLQHAFPKQDTTNEQIEEINALLGTSFDTWDDIVNVSLGAQAFREMNHRLQLGIELDLGAGGIEGEETTAAGLHASFEQTYAIFVNVLGVAHVILHDGERLRPFVLLGAGVGYEKDRTRLSVRGVGDVRVDNDGAFPAATAGIGAQWRVREGSRWHLEGGVAYYWGRLAHHVKAEGELAPSPYVLADNDSSGPNYWLGVGRRF